MKRACALLALALAACAHAPSPSPATTAWDEPRSSDQALRREIFMHLPDYWRRAASLKGPEAAAYADVMIDRAYDFGLHEDEIAAMRRLPLADQWPWIQSHARAER